MAPALRMRVAPRGTTAPWTHGMKDTEKEIRVSQMKINDTIRGPGIYEGQRESTFNAQSSSMEYLYDHVIKL